MKVSGPCAQRSFSRWPPVPRMSMRSKAPVMASKPVAKMMMSNSYSASLVRMPLEVTRSIGVARVSTRVTLGWLYTS
jgi:hypothetical protein